MVTEIYVNNTKLDLFDDLDLRLNYQINDIRDVEKRATNFSYSFTIPGTKDNNILFGHIYEVGNDNVSYNPNKKADVQVYVDGNQVITGFLQLLGINRTNEDKIVYEVAILGNIGNLFSDIGEAELTDLDFSEYNHKYTRIIQGYSNIGRIFINGIFTDLGYFGGANPVGRGYMYPYINYGVGSPTNRTTESFFPALYVKEYVDKIFQSAGYTYKSDFFSSSFFKSLVIPFNKNKIPLTDEQIANRSAYVSRVTSSEYIGRTPTISGKFVSNAIWNNEIADPGNVADGFNFTAKRKGRYKLNFNLNLFEAFNTIGAPAPYPFYIVGGNIKYTLRLHKNGSIIYTLPGEIAHSTGPFYAQQYFTTTVGFDYDVTCNQGDYFFLNIEWDIPSSEFPSKIVNLLGQALNGIIYLGMQPGSTASMVAYNDGIVENDDCVVNQVIPEGVSQKEFISNIFSMFNLMVLDDPSMEKGLIIEPRDDFFNKGGKFVDWEKKLDRSNYSIKPLSELNAKTYIYKYKEDKDYYNTKYQETNGTSYGELKYVVDNDFLNGTKELELIFSPTPNASDDAMFAAAKAAGVAYGFPYNIPVSCPHFITYDNTGTMKPQNTNIRILYYGYYNEYGRWKDNGVSAGNYAYVGMDDDPVEPDFSLTFATPKEIYYGFQTGWTDSNLFTKYHYNTFREITDKNSKMLTGYFDLSPVDIKNFDFRDRIYIDGQYWRINKIEDYNPAGRGLTKVELINWLDPMLHVPTKRRVIVGPIEVYTSTTRNNQTILAGPILNADALNIVNNTITNSSSVSIQGPSNTVGFNSRGMIVGEDNDVGDNSSTIVIGSGNTVSSEVNNVTILSSNDKIVRESNIIVLGDSYVIRNAKGLIPIIDTVDGGIDTVQNPYNQVVAIDVVDSGEDSPRPLGSDSVVHIIDSGQDIVNPNTNII